MVTCQSPRDSLLIASLLTAAFAAGGCGDSREDQEDEGTPWRLSEPEAPEEPEEPEEPERALHGHWGRADDVGGCLAASSWMSFGPGGGFTYNDLNRSSCASEEQRGLFACEGMWAASWDDSRRSGVAEYACQSAVMSPSLPDARALTASFAVRETARGGRELTLKAWRLQPDGRWVRERAELLEYPPSAPGFPRERAETRITSTLRITQLDGEPLEELAELTLAPGELIEVTLALEIQAEVFFSFHGQRSEATERFELPGRVSASEGGVQVRALLEGPSDFEAWTAYLRARGVFARGDMTGAAFSLAFTRTLRAQPQVPGALWASGAWSRIDDVCEAYGTRAQEVGAREQICAP